MEEIDLSIHNYVLTRENDNKQILGRNVKFIEWDENGRYDSIHENPAIGRSCIVDPGSYGTFKWMTSSITEILSDTKFKTKNSTYYLHKV